MGLCDADDILSPRRLLGFAALERRDKGSIRQAPGLDLVHLQRLHHVLEEGTGLIDRLGTDCIEDLKT